MNLVSVIISSYNSAQYIIETLESVSNQTWKQIELIITDDCSGDDTIEICRNWLTENRSRFTSAKILTIEKNTGVSGNANRGLNVSKGDWIKFLGADDILKPDCIKNNMIWINSHPEIKVLFSSIEIYKDNFDSHNLIVITPDVHHISTGLMDPERSANSQYKILLVSDRIHFSPSVFLHRETLLAIGGFDERFKMLEDYPLWLNFTRNGHKLYFMNKVTVSYRRHAKAINNTHIDYVVNPNFFNSEEFRKEYIYPFLPKDLRLNARFIWFGSQIFRFQWLNKNGKLNKLLLILFTLYLNPFMYFIFLKKRLVKKLKHNEFYI